ncbi:UDP-glucose/GDP-mannose dehydrogenase [Rhodomicrobium vannielii ATCC 17100]|uniref:UDP-glucose/GDP-mannose dehydrogenase n=1 Tax=Rhodomicrobium vannielii (strain ATCC 17100 / DSM 162 / LMG 4299 / NCIMB 10020 / ATH 3.1.1) TaxID=648757 RepID=E3I892_RHOVT|nr:UDP-glucose/GDP-mannose dehydrogenase [Rhodomicrobium vannielii]ADP69717.1 UDP-glucose/GDP-mannose dehydrogenase [Rhodomicrobium vannielii ATCC 17100]
MDLSDKTIGVIGLGYVGLPLAVEFGKIRSVVGFDVSAARVADLREGIDRTREVEPHELAAARYLTYTTSLEELRSCGVFIVAESR